MNSDDVKCVVCYEIDTYIYTTTECMHALCGKCVHKINDICPCCNVGRRFYRNAFLGKLIGKLMTNCSSCDKEMTASQLKTHKCNKITITCGKCNYNGPSHMHLCIETNMICKYCNVRLKNTTDAVFHFEHCEAMDKHCEKCNYVLTTSEYMLHECITDYSYCYSYRDNLKSIPKEIFEKYLGKHKFVKIDKTIVWRTPNTYDLISKDMFLNLLTNHGFEIDNKDENDEKQNK